jgi:hypothetical protein
VRRRRALAVLLAASSLAAACTSAPSEPAATPTIIASAPPSVAPTPTNQPTPSPTETPSPTPNQADVPIFVAGAQLKTRTTVRLRDLPGTGWGVHANLPTGALVQVVAGPIRTDGYGWYLVRDVDPAEPTFIDGWIAAGFAPDAFLAASGADPSPGPADPTFVAGYAGTASADFGPFRVEGSTALRWAAAVPSGAAPNASCTFTGSLKPARGDTTPVVFLTTTVSEAPAPGTTQPSFLAAHPTLTGDVFLHVDSDCSWAVTVVRLPL